MAPKPYNGVLPLALQAQFDAAKSLELGRKGRSLGDFRAPDLLGAQQAFKAAFADLEASLCSGALAESADVSRVAAKFSARLAEVERRLAQAPLPPVVFDEALRAHKVVVFDTARHPLREAVGAVLQVPEQALDGLHRAYAELDGPPPLCPALLCALAMQRKLPTGWGLLAGRRKEHIRQFRRSGEFAELARVFRGFVEQVVVPLVGEDVAFQTPPTLRCQLPSHRPLGHRHRDDEYEGHQAASINFWLPLTRVWGANTLWVESEPRAGDFAPVELEYGQAFRFNGGQCEHHTVANTTDATRVSLDWRVVPLSCWRDEFGGRIGSYPCEVTACFAAPAPRHGQ